MVFFAGLMLWSYRASEYADPALGKTSVLRPLVDRYAAAASLSAQQPRSPHVQSELL